MTDDIIQIRVSLDRIFKKESYALVMKKHPVSFQLYDLSGNQIYSDLRDRAYDRDQLGRLTHYSTIDYGKDHFYGFGEKTGYLDKKGKHMRMSPKDAIGFDPEFGEPLYKHIPFYIRINEDHLHALGLFYNQRECQTHHHQPYKNPGSSDQL